jgi:HAD superfamily hydrolase (TIGR01509 family)
VGLHLSETDTRQTMGLRIDDAVRHWWDRHPWAGMTRVEVERATTQRVAELIALEGEPMPGALEAVELCARLSLPVAVCSGSYAVVIEAALCRLGIASQVTVWHSAEWEPLGKPHPGSYLSTAAKLGIHPALCLAVEDSFNGAISAKAARMRVVAVPEPAALGSPRWGFCDLVLDSLVSFDEAALRSIEGGPAAHLAGNGTVLANAAAGTAVTARLQSVAMCSRCFG